MSSSNVGKFRRFWGNIRVTGTWTICMKCVKCMKICSKVKYLIFHLCMIFQEKCFSFYILLTDRISFSDCLYFSRYLSICVLQLLTRLGRNKLEINLIFLIKPLRYVTKKWRPKLKYLENEKSFWGEIKSISHHF